MVFPISSTRDFPDQTGFSKYVTLWDVANYKMAAWARQLRSDSNMYGLPETEPVEVGHPPL